MAFSDGVIADMDGILGSSGEFVESIEFRRVRDGVAGPWESIYGIVVEVEPIGVVGEPISGKSIDVQIKKSDVSTISVRSDQVRRDEIVYRVKDVLAQDAASWRLHCASG